MCIGIVVKVVKDRLGYGNVQLQCLIPDFDTAYVVGGVDESGECHVHRLEEGSRCGLFFGLHGKRRGSCRYL